MTQDKLSEERLAKLEHRLETASNSDRAYERPCSWDEAGAMARELLAFRSALTAPPAREISEAEVERAARRSYQYEGDRRGIDYAGWDMEPEGVKEEWRASCRAALEAARSPS
jgi:hypothetical protein